VSTPTIEILTTKTCPHTEAALSLVRTVAAALVPDAAVAHTVVRTEAQARELVFRGSPTVRVGGVDLGAPSQAPAGEAAVADVGLDCRSSGEDALPPRWLVEAAILRALGPRSFLFLCVANSARSQMAEGIARSLAPKGVAVASAGSEPSSVRPEAVTALAEIGVDIAGHRSKPVSVIPPDDVEAVITLCAEEVCPVWLGKAHRVHWGMPDPAAVEGAGRLDAFRATRDELRRRLAVLLST
jgi:arsenate reductase